MTYKILAYNFMMALNYVGTSGYFYLHWKRVFYPEDLPSKGYLNYYVEYFDTLELNSTFYHIPKVTTVKNWRRTLPEGFVLSIKANKLITHVKRLKDTRKSIEEFTDLVLTLDEKLGVILYQLPPSLKVNLNLLEDFLSALAKYKVKTAVEFRHRSWLSEEVFRMLKEGNVAVCISDGPGFPYTEEATADFVYIRLHGRNALYASEYKEEELIKIEKMIKGFNKKRLSSYVYFNNDFEGFAVKNALTLKKLLQK